MQLPTRRGRPNAGVVVDADGITVVDTLMTPDQYEPFAAAVDELGLPVRRCVLTGSGVEQAGGTGRFGLAAVYGSRQASVHLDQPPNVESWRALFPEEADAFDEVVTRRVSHVVAADVQLTDAVAVLTTGGQMEENLVAVVPGAQSRVRRGHVQLRCHAPVLAGHPAHWADELDRLVDLGAHRRARARPHRRRGGGARPAALPAGLRRRRRRPRAPGRGPWEAWTDRDHDVVNVERAAMLAAGDDGVPPSMLRLAGLA